MYSIKVSGSQKKKKFNTVKPILYSNREEKEQVNILYNNSEEQERIYIPNELINSTSNYIKTVNSIRQSHWNDYIFSNLTQDNLIDFVLSISE